MKIPRHYYENDFLPFESYLLSKKHRIVHYPMNSYIFSDLSVINVYCYIIKGSCATIGIDSNGNEKLMLYYSQGMFLNVCYQKESYSVYHLEFFRALTDVTLLLFEEDIMSEIIQENFEFTKTILNHHNDLLTLLSYQSISLPYLKSETKLCDFLYMSYQFPPSAFKETPHLIYISQETLASYLGITRTQVTRLLKILKEQDLIKTHRGHIELTDIQNLLKKCSPFINPLF